MRMKSCFQCTKISIMVAAAVGLLLSMSFGAMAITKTFNVKDFYDEGAEKTFTGDALFRYQKDITVAGNEVWPKSNQAVLRYQKPTTFEANYLKLVVSGLNGKEIPVFVKECDDKNVYAQQQVMLQDGENSVALNGVPQADRVKIVLNADSQTTFTLHQVNFLEKEPKPFAYKTFFKYTVICFGGYLLLLVIGGLFVHVKDAKKSNPINKSIQTVYLVMGRAGRYFGKHQGKNGRLFRVSLFLLLVLYLLLADIWALYGYPMYRYHMLVLCLFCILLGLVSWEKELHFVHWNRVVSGFFFATAGVTCIIDLIQYRYYNSLGVVLFFGFGFLFFVWMQMEKPHQMMKDFLLAVVLSFGILWVYTMISRPVLVDFTYAGPFRTATAFSFYLIVVIAALFSFIYYLIEENKHLFFLLLAAAMLSAAIWLLFKTQVFEAMIVAAVIGIIQLVRLLQLAVKQQKWGFLLLRFFLCVVVVLAAEKLTSALNYQLADKMDTQMIYQTDENQYQVGSDEQALTNQLYLEKLVSQGENRISHITKECFKARKEKWKITLKETNLWGHKSELSIYGTETEPGSGMLQMLYRYGIWILIPYTGMMVSFVVLSFKSSQGKRKCLSVGGFEVLSAGAAFVCFFTVGFETPFASLLWFTLYFMIGSAMHKEGESCKI